MKLIPHRLAARTWYTGIRSLASTGSRVGPRSKSVALPPVPTIRTLTLKLFRRERAISTFDDTFNPPHSSSHRFSTQMSSVLHGVLPPLHPGHASVTWFRVYRPQLDAPLRLAFASAPAQNALTSLVTVSRRIIMQKARGQAFPYGHSPPTACRHVVSGSLSSPCRGSSHLSLALLVRYRSPEST